MRKLFVIIFAIIGYLCSYAQISKSNVQQRVAQLSDYISFMADKSKPLDTRNYYKNRALNLFIGKGEPFEQEGILNTGVKMETTSIYRKKPYRRLIKDYFTGLTNLRYAKVDIQSTNFIEIEVSDLQKVEDNKYVCTACFEQVFVGYREGRPCYTDRTRKKVKVYIFGEETIDGSFDGQESIILLGDVTAFETTKM